MQFPGDNIFASSGLRYLNIAQYDGGSELEREMLAPAVPAIYVWVHDFVRLLGLRADLVDDELKRFSGQQGRNWPLSGDHFLQGELRVNRPDLAAERREIVVREISANTPIGRSISVLATLQQRPLYCGISVNLGQRISQHMQQKTSLAGSLTTIGLSECAVLWMEITEPAAVEAGLLNAKSAEAEHIEDPLDSDDEYLAKQVPILKAFESLMIRVAMPMVNKSLDS